MNLKNKNFLLTGGTGYIGSITAKEILKNGGKLIFSSGEVTFSSGTNGTSGTSGRIGYDQRYELDGITDDLQIC